MFNITKQGSSLLITSNDNSQFPWKDGQMSLPMNSVVYVIDNSDYIAFRSASNNDILFTALIDEIQINGTNVTKDDFILTFDNVANSAGGGGGSASAGVNSINGFQGDLTLKTVNGNSLIGSGNITIEGGGITEESDPIFTSWKNGTSIALGKNNNANTNGVNIGYDNGTANGAGIMIGSYLTGHSGSIIVGVDTKSNNDGEILLGSAVKSNTGETTSDKTHVGFAKYGASYGNEANCFEIRQDNSIYIWNADNTEMIKLQDNLGGGSGSAGVEAINIGNGIEDYTQKTGIVSFYTLFYDGSYDVSIGGTSFYGLKPIDGSIVLENAGGTVNGNFRCGIKVNEWVGTQAQYDALGTYDSGCTYYITE